MAASSASRNVCSITAAPKIPAGPISRYRDKSSRTLRCSFGYSSGERAHFFTFFAVFFVFASGEALASLAFMRAFAWACLRSSKPAVSLGSLVRLT